MEFGEIAIADGVSLRPLQPDEVAPLAAALAAMEPWSRYTKLASNLPGYLAASQPGAPRFAIVSDGVAAGVLGLRLEWLFGPYLQFIGVLPQHQGKGLGSTTIRWFLRETERRGTRNAWICVSDFNVRARQLYEAHGFEAIATLDGLVEPGIREILMRRTFA